MTLTPAQLDLLDRRARAAASGTLGKVMHRPWHLLYSKWKERRCIATGTAFPTTAATFWGAPMNVVFPERVSLTIYRYGFFEDDLTRVFALVLKPGMTFFDVGSHFGYFSLLAGHLVGHNGRVHAFEPTPSTFEVMRSNLARIPNARANNMALWSVDETLTFNDFGIEFSAFNSFGESKLSAAESARVRAKSVAVQARSLDSYVQETGVTPDFLKIDTEGAEFEVLRGMEKLLTTTRPSLTLEVGDVGGAAGRRESRRVVDHMLARGYTAYELRGHELAEHTPQDTYDYGNILFRPKP